MFVERTPWTDANRADRDERDRIVRLLRRLLSRRRRYQISNRVSMYDVENRNWVDRSIDRSIDSVGRKVPAFPFPRESRPAGRYFVVPCLSVSRSLPSLLIILPPLYLLSSLPSYPCLLTLRLDVHYRLQYRLYGLATCRVCPALLENKKRISTGQEGRRSRSSALLPQPPLWLSFPLEDRGLGSIPSSRRPKFRGTALTLSLRPAWRRASCVRL